MYFSHLAIASVLSFASSSINPILKASAGLKRLPLAKKKKFPRVNYECLYIVFYSQLTLAMHVLLDGNQ